MLVPAQVGTQGAFSYQIVNILEAQSSIVNVTYFCGANNLNNANSATLVVEQLAVATIFQVSTNLDTAFQLEARELNGSLIPLPDNRVAFTTADASLLVHFTITPVAVVAV